MKCSSFTTPDAGFLRLQRKRENRTLWKKLNPEKVRAYQQKRYAKNRDRIISMSRAWAVKNKERAARILRRWKIENKPLMAAYSQRNKAIRRGCRTDCLVDNVIRSWRTMPSFVCWHCGNEFPINNLHVDHVIPVSRMGSHTVDNICASCSSCNLSKGAKLGTLPAWCFPSEWVIR